MKTVKQKFIILATIIVLLNGIMLVSCQKESVTETVKTQSDTISNVSTGDDERVNCSADCVLGSCEVDCGPNVTQIECKCVAALVPKCKCKMAAERRTPPSIYQSEEQRQNVTDLIVFIKSNFVEGQDKQVLLERLLKYQETVTSKKQPGIVEVIDSLEAAFNNLSEPNKQKLNVFLQNKGYPPAF